MVKDEVMNEEEDDGEENEDEEAEDERKDKSFSDRDGEVIQDRRDNDDNDNGRQRNNDEVEENDNDDRNNRRRKNRKKNNRERRSTRTNEDVEKPTEKNIWLYNIIEDPEEAHDVADANPEIVELLLVKLSVYMNEAALPRYPCKNPKASPINNNGEYQ